MEELPDAGLVELARQGDRTAFGVLVQRYEAVTLRFALRILGKDVFAQDCLQEAVLQAYLSIASLRQPEHFKSWLCGIILNVCRSHLRDREPEYFSLEVITEGIQFQSLSFPIRTATPEELAENRDLYRTVFDAVNALSKGDRDVLLAFYFAQLSVLEIAKLHVCPPSTVKVHLHRARKRLGDYIKEHHPEIIPPNNRREPMIEVIIVDIVKREFTLRSDKKHTMYVLILRDDDGKRALPIWIAERESQVIAMGMKEFALSRPLTIDFMLNLLLSMKAQVKEVRIQSLKADTFYAIVKVICGKKIMEIDARPSDAISLAVRTSCPIYVAENVIERGGIEVPIDAVTPTGQGINAILDDIRNLQAEAMKSPKHPVSKAELDSMKKEVVAAVFGS